MRESEGNQFVSISERFSSFLPSSCFLLHRANTTNSAVGDDANKAAQREGEGGSPDEELLVRRRGLRAKFRVQLTHLIPKEGYSDAATRGRVCVSE